MQNMCAKLVLNKRKYDSATETLRNLHWLPIKVTVEFKLARTVYKCMIWEAPSYLNDLLHHHRSTDCDTHRMGCCYWFPSLRRKHSLIAHSVLWGLSYGTLFPTQ